MATSNEIHDVLPLPLVKLTQEYVGIKICMSEHIYNIMLDLLVEYIEKKWEKCNIDLLIDLIMNEEALDLVMDILDKANIKDTIFWEYIYTYLPITWLDIFLNKYGDFISTISFEPSEDWIKENREEYMYKVDKLNEYIKTHG